MDPEDKMRFAAGETDEIPPAPPARDAGLDEEDAVRKDMRETPSSEAETEHKQGDEFPETIDDDIDPDDVRAVPGTGGPDDAGDVDVDPEDLNLSGHA